jgi:hypothetical protein
VIGHVAYYLQTQSMVDGMGKQRRGVRSRTKMKNVRMKKIGTVSGMKREESNRENTKTRKHRGDDAR